MEGRALRVLAAGSLRSALSAIARAFESSGGGHVVLTFGASGLLKDRVAFGESEADVFASANLEHPRALHEAGRADAPRTFVRNSMCVLAGPRFALDGRPLASRLLDGDVRIGISTPGADPSGDYAWQLFDRIEASGAAPPGSAAALKRRARALTGGSASRPRPRADRSVYAQLVADGEADAFVTYRTNAVVAARQVPGLTVIDVPEAFEVAADYGIAAVGPVRPAAAAFVDFVLGAEAQRVFAGHGFAPP